MSVVYHRTACRTFGYVAQCVASVARIPCGLITAERGACFELHNEKEPLSCYSNNTISAVWRMLVDVREAADFEGAYLAGAINIGLKGKYATWAGSMLSHDTPVVVIGDGENEEECESGSRLRISATFPVP